LIWVKRPAADVENMPECIGASGLLTALHAWCRALFCAQFNKIAESSVTMRIQLAMSAMLLAVWVFAPDTAAAQMSPSVQRGRTFVMANCSRCHAVDKVSPSPLPIAPAFRTLHQHYPVEDLQEALAEGIRTGHPNMPAFRLDPGQISDVISYLKTLER